MAGHTQNVEWRSRQNEATPTDSYSQVCAGATTAIITHPILRVTCPSSASTLTLPNGNPGQLIKIICDDSTADVDVTPTTSTEFTAIALDTDGDACLLLYANDTDGWIIVSVTGTAAGAAPAYTVAS